MCFVFLCLVLPFCDLRPVRECGIPLLRHCLDAEPVNANADGAPLLELLLNVTLVSSDDDPSTSATDSSKAPRKGGDATPGLFYSVTAERLFYTALRAPGQPQLLALRALTSKGIVAATAGRGSIQRQALLRALVEVSLSGADWNLVTAAARALPARPEDISAVIVDLVDISGVSGSSATPKASDRTSCLFMHSSRGKRTIGSKALDIVFGAFGLEYGLEIVFKVC